MRAAKQGRRTARCCAGRTTAARGGQVVAKGYEAASEAKPYHPWHGSQASRSHSPQLPPTESMAAGKSAAMPILRRESRHDRAHPADRLLASGHTDLSDQPSEWPGLRLPELQQPEGCRVPGSERPGRTPHRTKPRLRLMTSSAYWDRRYKRALAAVKQNRPGCEICGGPGADTVDHRIPIALFPEGAPMGEINAADNLRPAHRSCNLARKRPRRRWKKARKSGQRAESNPLYR